MASKRKSPAAGRKKVTASARVHTSPNKAKKSKDLDLGGSYFLATGTVNAQPSNSQGSSSDSSTIDAILVMLQKLDDSNKVSAKLLYLC